MGYRRYFLLPFISLVRQESFEFVDEDGQMQQYSSTTRKTKTLSNMKIVALVSHVEAQSTALLTWLSKAPVGHAIFVRQYDDTNVWVAPTADASDPDAEDNQVKKVGKLGRRRCAPLLGILQHVFVRRVDQYEADTSAESVQIHAPSQILPKVGCACA